tara:strand:- start:350 stop:562 length:213 start_codon:yes stop_codon:yes gene_type:complete
MHQLEYMLCLLAARIEHEVKDAEMAKEVLSLASQASFFTPPEAGSAQLDLDEQCEEWRRKYDHLMHSSKH